MGGWVEFRDAVLEEQGVVSGELSTAVGVY
jgi:hypothetical protein